MRQFIRIVESFVQETAPSDTMRSQTFYHGTPIDSYGRNILQHGVIPGNQGTTSRGHMTPVAGRSYLTPSLKYGVIYCIGGNMLGCSEDDAKYLVNMSRRGESASQFGWLFVIYGEKLVTDIQPDEDSVGEAAHYADIILHHPKHSIYYNDEQFFQALEHTDRQWLINFHHNAQSSMTRRQWSGVIDGSTLACASGGKRFLRRMNDRDKLNLIACGAHISYKGDDIVPDQAWRFDKMKVCDLTKDGSNFFQLAERVR